MPARIIVWELGPQIVKTQRTEYGICDGMEQGIAVRMGDRPHIVFDTQASQHQGAAFWRQGQSVAVVTVTNANRRIHCTSSLGLRQNTG